MEPKCKQNPESVVQKIMKNAPVLNSDSHAQRNIR